MISPKVWSLAGLDPLAGASNCLQHINESTTTLSGKHKFKTSRNKIVQITRDMRWTLTHLPHFLVITKKCNGVSWNTKKGTENQDNQRNIKLTQFIKNQICNLLKGQKNTTLKSEKFKYSEVLNINNNIQNGVLFYMEHIFLKFYIFVSAVSEHWIWISSLHNRYCQNVMIHTKFNGLKLGVRAQTNLFYGAVNMSQQIPS